MRQQLKKGNPPGRWNSTEALAPLIWLLLLSGLELKRKRMASSPWMQWWLIHRDQIDIQSIKNHDSLGDASEKGIHEPSIRYKSAHRRRQVRSLPGQATLEMHDWLQVTICTTSHSAFATLRRESIKISHLLIDIHRKRMTENCEPKKWGEGLWKNQVWSCLQASEWKAMQKTSGIEQCRPTGREMD